MAVLRLQGKRNARMYAKNLSIGTSRAENLLAELPPDAFQKPSFMKQLPEILLLEDNYSLVLH